MSATLQIGWVRVLGARSLGTCVVVRAVTESETASGSCRRKQSGGQKRETSGYGKDGKIITGILNRNLLSNVAQAGMTVKVTDMISIM